MTGLLLLGVLGVWVVMVLAAVLVTFRKLPNRLWRVPLIAVLLFALIPLPLADELIGSQQLRALCAENGPKEEQFAGAQGMTLYEHLEGNLPVSNQVLATTAFKWTLQDRINPDVVVSFVDYRVKGGWFVRMLNISETNAPLIFHSGCWRHGKESFQGWLDKYRIQVVFRK